MIRARFGAALAVAGLLFGAAAAQADVKAQQKTQVKFEGMLGRMFNLFGGKSAREGVVETVVVKGDRKATIRQDAATIVDLAEEKVYEVNLKDKSYKVVTFAQLRKQMEEARAKAEEEARKSEAREKEKKDPNQKEMDVDFAIKETGQSKEINGFSCKQYITTIAVHEKGKTLEQAGGILMTADSWLAPTIAAMKEVSDFDVRYAKKLLAGTDLPTAADMMQAMAMYPGMKQAMARFQNEKVKMDGTPVQTIVTMQSVRTPEQAAQAKKQDDEKPASPGGALGGLMGRFGRKKAADDTKDKDAAAASTKATTDDASKATFMTSTTDVLSVSTSIDPADLQVPAGFKLK